MGTTVFSTRILGIITTDAGLDNTDATLGLGTTMYPTGLVFRSLELPYAITPDSVTLGSDDRTFSFVSNTAAVLDQMRIITLVPEPSSIVLSATGATLAALAYRRKRSSRG